MVSGAARKAWAHGLPRQTAFGCAVCGSDVGMYLRRTQRRRKDGSVVGYVQLAHNRRVDGVTRAEVLLNLGREDELDVEGLRRLAASITRYADGEGALAPLGAGSGAATSEGELEVQSSRALGGVWLLDALWRRLGVERGAWAGCSARGASRPMSSVCCSRWSPTAPWIRARSGPAAEWASEDVAIPGLDGIDEDQCYRAMDLLVEADTEGRVQEAVFFACADLLNLEVDLLFFDTTSHVLRARRARPRRRGRRAGVPRLRAQQGSPPRPAAGRDRPRGHPRGDPGPGVGLARQHQRHVACSQEVKDDLRGWRLGRVVTVVDRGFSSDENLRYLTRAGGHWIAGERMRDGSRGRASGALAPRPLPDRPRQPARQGGPGRRRRRGQALHRLPQPRRGRPRQDGPRRHDRAPAGRA